LPRFRVATGIVGKSSGHGMRSPPAQVIRLVWNSPIVHAPEMNTVELRSTSKFPNC